MRAIVVHRLAYGGSIILLALAAIWGPALNFPIAWKIAGTVLAILIMSYWVKSRGVEDR